MSDDVLKTVLEIGERMASAPAAKRPRRSTVAAELKAAKRAGATAVTLPSGVRVEFGEEASTNEWDEAMKKARGIHGVN